MRILIAAKQRTLRNALKGLLQTRPGYDIVGTAADKEALFAQAETKAPDLLLLDETLTVFLMEEVLIPLQLIDPCPSTIVLGNQSESRKVYLDAGVTAVVEKTDHPKSLLTAIEGIRLWKDHG